MSNRVFEYDEQLNLRCEGGLRQAIKQAALIERVPSSEFIRRCIRRGVEESGVPLPPLDAPSGGRQDRGEAA